MGTEMYGILSDEIHRYRAEAYNVEDGDVWTILQTEILRALKPLEANVDKTTHEVDWAAGRQRFCGTSGNPALSATNIASRKDPIQKLEFIWDQNQLLGRQPQFVGWLGQSKMPVYTILTVQSNGKGTAEAPQGLKGAIFAALTYQAPTNASDFELAILAGPIVVWLS